MVHYNECMEKYSTDEGLPQAIFHMDGDAFFVGVEIAKNPKLKGLPVVTGQERGIVTALSYEAKALGVTRGFPIFKMKKEFPTVIILPGDYESYAEYSEKMFNIVRRYSDDVEEYSIDECFADLTAMRAVLKMSYAEIAQKIKNDVAKEMNLTVSVGLAPTKVLAKVASKCKKPNGFTIIRYDEIDQFLTEISIGKIWGVGPQTSQYLRKLGLETALDFKNQNLSWIEHHVSKPYKSIWQELCGVPVMSVDPNRKDSYSSMQKTKTFYPQTTQRAFLFSQLSKHAEDVCAKARHYHLTAQTISIFLKNEHFRYLRAEIKLLIPLNLPELLIPTIEPEFERLYKKLLISGARCRATGVTLHGLVSSKLEQQDLFGGQERAGKFESIHKQIDVLEDKFGRHIVHLGSTQGALNQKKIGKEFKGLNRDILFL